MVLTAGRAGFEPARPLSGPGALAPLCTRPGYATSPGVPSTAGCAQSTGEVASLAVERRVRAAGVLHLFLELGCLLRRIDLPELLLHLLLGLLHVGLDPFVHVAPPRDQRAGRVPP